MPPVGLSPVYPRKPQPTRDCTNCIFYITDCIFLPRPQPAKKRENPQAAVDFARHRAILKINSTGASCPGAERHAERNGISNGKQFQLLFAHRDRLRPGAPRPRWRAHVQKYGGTRVLVVYGSQRVVRSGLLDSIIQPMEQAGIKCFTLGGVVPNPHLSKVYEGIEIGKREGIGLPAGGGRRFRHRHGLRPSATGWPSRTRMCGNSTRASARPRAACRWRRC